jgi:hypothetical protein
MTTESIIPESPMARVPITVMGFRCDRCGHEWIPRGGSEEEPRLCPKCHSAYWNVPKKAKMDYEHFKAKIAATLKSAGKPLTWTEIRTAASLPQLFPNNQWVHRLEGDVGLSRKRESGGTIHWQLGTVVGDDAKTAEAANKARPRARSKQSAVE